MAQRIRSKVNDSEFSEIGPVHEKFFQNGALVNEYDISKVDIPSWGVPGLLTRYDEESMVDYSSKSRGPKPVTHLRRKMERYNIGVTDLTLVSGGTVNRYLRTGSQAHWSTWGPYGDIYHRHIGVSWPMSDSAFARKARDSFYNTNEVDSVLNIVESPELVTGLKDLYEKVHGVRELEANLPSGFFARAKVREKLFRTKLKFYSGGYLYYAFGIAPLVADMRKISKALKSLSKDMERSLKHTGAVKTVHASMTGSLLGVVADGNGDLPAGYSLSPNDGGWWTSDLKALSPPTKTFTIRGIREQHYDTKLFAQMSYLVDRFGGKGPANYLYQRIPFSFVLDWFVDTSSVISALDNALTGSTKVVYDACISTKYNVLAPIKKVQRDANTTDGNDGSITSIVELNSYHRIPAAADISVGSSGRFGKRQGFLSVALLAQQAANLKRQKASYK